MANELSVNGGTNYTNALTVGPTSLRNVAKQSFDHWNRDEVCTGDLAVAYNNAVNAGASGPYITTVPSTVMVQVRRLLNVSEDDMNKMLLFLECALGAHRNPPL